MLGLSRSPPSCGVVDAIGVILGFGVDVKRCRKGHLPRRMFRCQTRNLENNQDPPTTLRRKSSNVALSQGTMAVSPTILKWTTA